MIDLPSPAERLAEAQRLLEGLNGQWVAERMGLQRDKISKWRRGDRTPTLEDLLRLPEATGRPLSADLRHRIFGSPTDAAGKDTPEAVSG